MIHVLALLGMGAGGSTPVAEVTAGREQTILETPHQVEFRGTDFALHGMEREGFVAVGVPETRYRQTIVLNWSPATWSIREHLRLHHQGYLAGGSKPFQWVLPGSTEEYFVRYASNPRLSHRGPGGGTATVILGEVLLTDD